ncbi:MAG: phosphoribosylanthranilate isomerase [Candidatus Glassbacteria bacterium]|nr:phosphoribosylanthranilate isomerase [Candidatus Glassbacteria bacterium]
MRVRIKICGITRIEDAMAAVELGVDALGFIFHPPSPRYVEPAAAADIISRLPALVSAVGVFVDEDINILHSIVGLAGLDAVQLQGVESAEYCKSLGPIRCIKGFRLASRLDLRKIEEYPLEVGILLDSYQKDTPGGTGKTFDWQWAAEAQRQRPIILAGGLGPNNVVEAVRRVRPFAVDVSSSLEKSPGIKDHEKMADFVATVSKFR